MTSCTTSSLKRPSTLDFFEGRAYNQEFDEFWKEIERKNQNNIELSRLLPLVPVRLDIASARHNEILATARIMWREARTMGGRQP
jgi:hypothetical protein